MGDDHIVVADEAAAAGGDGENNLWSIIAQQSAQAGPDQTDINVLLLGDKGVGKSTLIQKIIKKDDVSIPKPTTALEYTHGKREERSGMSNQVKVAHFWELGGGQHLDSLIDIVITPENIHTLVVVLVVDLSAGRDVFTSLYFWITRIRKRVGECFVEMNKRGTQIPSRMIQRMHKRFGAEHADLLDGSSPKVTIIGVPMCIVGTKWDLFRDEGTEATKVMSKTLRYIAHLNAASLIYTNYKDEKDLSKYRSLMNSLIFGGTTERVCQLEYTKALLVWAGKDNFSDIGPPNEVQRGSSFVPTGDDKYDNWKAQFEVVFPAKDKKDALDDLNFDQWNPEYAEPEVDKMRLVKDDELEQYRQAKAKQAREAEAAEKDKKKKKKTVAE